MKQLADMPTDMQPCQEQPSSVVRELLDSSSDDEHTLVLTASLYHDILTCELEPLRDVPETHGKSLGKSLASSHVDDQVEGPPGPVPSPCPYQK